jgi:uncharacterized protein YjbI with pentapeptide repeats
MVSDEHVALLKQGVAAWNTWRDENFYVHPDLSEANLRGADFSGANLTGAILYKADLTGTKFGEANLSRADLSRANLIEADLIGADLTGASLGGANLSGANLSGADLTGANLSRANLYGAKLRDAGLRGADLSRANLIEADLSGASLTGASLSGANLSGADFTGANLSRTNLYAASLVQTRLSATTMTGAKVYGASVWDVKTDEKTKQTELIITPDDQPAIMVDDLEIAQFIYLLLNRDKIRNVIDTVTRKGVLLLGRFGDGGLLFLQALAAWLRMPENGGFLPLLFDFPRPESKTYTETIRTLASLARFVIVDLTGSSLPQEITATVDLCEIPFVPILEQNRKDWSMFKDFLVKERVLKLVRFSDQSHLLQLLAKEVIAPAEKLIEKRQQRLDEIFGRA